MFLRNPSYFKVKKNLYALSGLTFEQRRSYIRARIDIIEKASSTWTYPKFKVGTDVPMTKEDLINAEGVSGVKNQKHFYCETSGSSGEVLKFSRNEVWDSVNRASIDIFKARFGALPYDKTIYFWGISSGFWAGKKTRFLDLIMNRRRIFTYNETELLKFARKNNDSAVIEGYSSSINELAKVCIKYDVKFSNIKLVKATSEKIFPEYRSNVRKAFNVQLFGEYGSAETGLIGFECDVNNYHVLKNNVMVTVDEHNEIYVTNLWSESFPVINYRLGDYVSISPHCSCGLDGPIITSIEGRVGKMILGYSDSYPSLYLYYVFKVLAVEYDIELTYVAVQHKVGELFIHFERNLTEKESRLLLKVFKSYFGEDLISYIITGLPKKTGKKRKDFISHV